MIFYNWESFYAILNNHYEMALQEKEIKRFKRTGNQFRKNLQLKDVF